MNRFEERLSHTLKEVRMTDADRSRVRERLVHAASAPHFTTPLTSNTNNLKSTPTSTTTITITFPMTTTVF
jgi:hypothetical protein